MSRQECLSLSSSLDTDQAELLRGISLVRRAIDDRYHRSCIGCISSALLGTYSYIRIATATSTPSLQIYNTFLNQLLYLHAFLCAFRTISTKSNPQPRPSPWLSPAHNPILIAASPARLRQLSLPKPADSRFPYGSSKVSAHLPSSSSCALTSATYTIATTTSSMATIPIQSLEI